jgi:hypothetical protein
MRAFGTALQRLVRPDRHIVLRLLYEQPVTPADLLSVPRLDAPCEAMPGCCDAWATQGADHPAG